MLAYQILEGGVLLQLLLVCLTEASCKLGKLMEGGCHIDLCEVLTM